MAARVIGGATALPTVVGAPKSGYTPAVDDLVIRDTTVNFGFDLVATDENPVGRIIALNRAKTVLTVEMFTTSNIVQFTYSAAPSRGDKIEVGGTSNQVRADNSNGVGVVVAVDAPSGTCHVAF